jgi:aspartate/methionine/tyrosine aminotransferase
VTSGSSGAFILAFLSMFDAGARVAIASPGYPPYQNIMHAFGIEPAVLQTEAVDRHAVTAAMIEAEHRRKPLDGVLLMSPANPSGTMLSEAALRAVCEVCDRLGIAFISDEIYHGLTYEMPAQTALAFSRRAVVVNSFSKYYCMTGWRVGWMIVPDELIRPIERLQQNLSISVPTLSQIGAEAAFEATEELEEVRESYARNRAVLLDALPGLGLGDYYPADGAFYIYADVARLTNDSRDFCRRMLEGAGVATTPGLDFDRARGSHTLRMSFAGSEADIIEAVRRLKAWAG